MTGDAHPSGHGKRPPAPRAVLPAKLKPALTRSEDVPRRLVALLRPVPGRLVLVHAAAGYGKTAALAASQRPGWLWYNLDPGDREPLALASRLCAALGAEPLPPDLPPVAETVAMELAERLQGRTPVITLDRLNHVADVPEVGRLLSELIVLLPALCVRAATRTRPLLPLERLRVEGRLVEVGPAQLRLSREEVAHVLASAWGRPPEARELDFADGLLAGWPAALHLWLAELDYPADLMGPLQPGRPLHDYLHEEVLAGTLTPEAMSLLRADLRWLVGTGPLRTRATRPDRRRVMDLLVRDRVGVVPGPGGWHVHPLVSAFLAMHQGQQEAARPPAPAREAETARPRGVAIVAFGGLAVRVDGAEVEESAWPTAARRLLEVLLCLPGCQATAQQAARLLWPRHLPRSALNSFNVALHGLRRLLEPDLTAGAESRYVSRLGRQYHLRLDRLSCDAEDFAGLVRGVTGPLDEEGARRLEAAGLLYQGDFLAASSDDFVREKRARLRRLALDALERLGEWHAAGGRSAQALRAYDRLLELAPNREDVWALVLELHLAAGDEYRALAALQRCQQSLASVGIEPSGLLRSLHHRIRREPPEERYGT